MDWDRAPDPGGLALLGHNGAGKTTFLHFLVGLWPQQNGHPFLARWHQARPIEASRRVGFVPGTPRFDPRLTVDDHLKLAAAWTGVGKRSRALETARDWAGVAALGSRRAGKLSRGWRQRLMLAMALVGDPGILVLDEPFEGLDPFMRRDMIATLAEFRTSGRLFLATHDLDAAADLCTRAWILQAGRFAFEGTLPESGEEVAALLAAYPPENART